MQEVRSEGGGSSGDFTPGQLAAAQHEYAWRWFSFHAGQRVSMFNYFFVGCGIFFAGLASLLSKSLYFESFVLSFVGGVLCLLFLFLDIRNRDLITIGEKALISSEKSWLFKGALQADNNGGSVGILACDAHEFGEPQFSKFGKNHKTIASHKFLIPAIEVLMLLTFLFCAVYALCMSRSHVAPGEQGVGLITIVKLEGKNGTRTSDEQDSVTKTVTPTNPVGKTGTPRLEVEPGKQAP